MAGADDDKESDMATTRNRSNTRPRRDAAQAAGQPNDVKAMREYRRMRVKGAPISVARDAACAKRTAVKMASRTAA